MPLLAAFGSNASRSVTFPGTGEVPYETITLTAPNGNLSISGNGTDQITSIFKTSGSNSWDNQAYTAQGYSAPCTIEFNANAGNSDNSQSYKMIGWNVDPTTNASYNSIDHASYPYQQNQYVVYNNGSNTNHAAWTSSQKFYLVYTSTGRIQHWNGSTKLYDVAYSPSTVYLDSSYYSPNGSPYSGFTNVRIKLAEWDGSQYV